MRVAEVLRLVSGSLQDLEPGLDSRWPWEGGDDGRIGLLDFFNAALRAVALQRPDVRALTETIRLEPGMRQRIPGRRLHGASHDASGFCELVRNMGQDGERPGASISPVQTDLIMAWANMRTVAAEVENFAYDRATNPAVYCVYPAVPEHVDVYVEATYYAAPDVVSSPDQSIGIPPEYAAALQHHVLAAVLGGDNESSNMNRSGYHLQQFNSLMGVKMQVDAVWPKAKNSIQGGM